MEQRLNILIQVRACTIIELKVVGRKVEYRMEKTYYDKKIAYLDYLERGGKVKNAGYVKWEVKNKECRIQIHIRGLYATDTLQGEILLLTGTKTESADTMQLHYGAGEYTGKWESENLAGTGISYETCQGIRIRLSESRYLETVWGEIDEQKTSQIIMVDEAKSEVAEPTSFTIEEATEASELPIKEVEEPIVIVEERKEEKEQDSIHIQEWSEEQESVKLQEEGGQNTVSLNEIEETKADTAQRDSKCKPERLSGDKWVQLNRIYPHIRPFGDKREYLSVGPRDFVVLTRRYQNLVQNSFLLHGYYNYGHVILTRIREEEEDVFYLGVPGVYYEREKQAALMFGFEGFESGTEVAGEGGFGYYMKRVDI